ncbi:MAG: HAMP domain-containing histidine kinase [Wolbachia endosymbiont of Fragariocoptes setiger]|nr:HAMP domain-containing histidine kinase [Wolbachia endosymbiont of Fragariocoptes setiger]
MLKQTSSIFAVLRKNKYLKTILLFLLTFFLVFGIMYYSYSLKKSFLASNINANMSLKKMLENGVIKKYHYLLMEKPNDLLLGRQHIKYKNFDYINQLVKLRSELLQLISAVQDINLILYDQNGRIIFSNLNTQDDQLLIDEFDDLLDHQEISYNRKGTVVSIFPIFYESVKPSFFLKVLRKYDAFYVTIYIVVFSFISILLIFLILIMYYLNISNSKVLMNQHKTNIELQQIKEVLEQENVNKLKFFASITHELRTPLNAVIGFAELIKNHMSDSDSLCKEYADEIYNAGTHLLSLINDILDFSKAESSSLMVKKVKFNLNRIIDSCVKMMLPKLQDTGIDFKQEIPDKQLLLTADPNRMKQIIINLLSNAIKFTPKGGFIKMVTREDIQKNLLTIEFQDNGVGIMQQDICKVMSVFGQAESGCRNEGTGIGLPLSKKLVEIMGGTFEIKSESNVGTIVTLQFSYEEETCEESIDF